MTDHVFDRAHLAEAVGNDITDMAHFWMLRKFQFLEPAREQFEIIVDPWLSYCEEPSQNEIMAYNWRLPIGCSLSVPIATARRCSNCMLTSHQRQLRPLRSSDLSRCAIRSTSRALAFWTRILQPAWLR